MSLDNGGRLEQHHRLQTARPQSVVQNPEQAVDRELAGAEPTAAGEEHAADDEGRGSLVASVYPKTPEFSAHSGVFSSHNGSRHQKPKNRWIPSDGRGG